MEFDNIFKLIETYHKELGFPKKTNFLEQDRDEANRVILALYAEVAELQESYPWKPWRPINYKEFDHQNMTEELADIIFFIGSFLEIFKIEPKALELMIRSKLTENYRRIENDYNKTNS